MWLLGTQFTNITALCWDCSVHHRDCSKSQSTESSLHQSRSRVDFILLIDWILLLLIGCFLLFIWWRWVHDETIIAFTPLIFESILRLDCTFFVCEILDYESSISACRCDILTALTFALAHFICLCLIYSSLWVESFTLVVWELLLYETRWANGCLLSGHRWE